MKRRFFITFLTCVIVSATLSGLFYEVLSAGLRKTSKDFQGKLNYVLKGNDHYNVVFAGSSRVMVQINPLLFDSLTKFNSYNAGVEGARIAELRVFIKKYLDSHGPPEYLFLNVDETALLTFSVWDFPRIMPYAGDPDFYALSKYQHEIAWGKYFPPLALTYYDDSRKSLALQALAGRQARLSAGETKGYKPMPFNEHANQLIASDSVNYDYTPDGVAALRAIGKLCGEKKIHLIILIPPALIKNDAKFLHGNAFEEQIKSLSPLCNLSVIDLRRDSVFYNNELFSDYMHFNPLGSEKYTEEIARKFLEITQTHLE